MKRFKNILVATDTRVENQNIIEEAVDRAEKNGAKLKLVDVVPPIPWTARLFLNDHEHMQELMIREKESQLEAIAAPIRAVGIEVSTKVLVGKTSVEIIREVLRSGHDLVMRIAKGAKSRRNGFFGTTGFRLLRECPCVVHLVGPKSSPPLKHVLACVDPSTDDAVDAELNETIFQLAEDISGRYDAKFSVVHSWTIDAERLLEGRMPTEDFERMKDGRQSHIRKLLDQFLKTQGCSADHGHMHLLKGDASIVIPQFAKVEDVDLVVMGTVGRSGAVGFLMGNTVEQILESIECSVLAVKLKGFVSPIRMDDA